MLRYRIYLLKNAVVNLNEYREIHSQNNAITHIKMRKNKSIYGYWLVIDAPLNLIPNSFHHF